MSVALEVTQEWGEVLLESRQYPDGDVVIGSSSGDRWRFLGVDMGFVPRPIGTALAWLAPIWSDVERTYRPDLLVPDSDLPDSTDWTLFTTEDGVRVARIAPPFGAEASFLGRTLDAAGLVDEGLARRAPDGTVVVPLVSGMVLRITAGHQTFTGKLAPRPPRIPVRPDPDFAFLSIAIPGSLLFVGLALVASLVVPFRTSTDAWSIVPGNRMVDIAFPKPAAQQGGGGGTLAAEKPEGRRLAKIKGPRTDSQVAKQAGILGNLDRLLGTDLPNGLAAAIGTLTGPNGHGIGGGGLGDRGDGLGGGGEAEGFAGGLCTGGDCSGGEGAGGGGFIAKQEGGIANVGGDPIVMGALDRGLIDEVIKRNMNSIRYCYQRDLQRNPDLEGKIVMKFTISPDGSVSSASVRSSSMGSASVEDCLTGRFLRMKFPEPKGGGIVVVSYPFLFGR